MSRTYIPYCTKCGKIKDATTYCKACWRIVSKEFREKNKERLKSRGKELYEKNKHNFDVWISKSWGRLNERTINGSRPNWKNPGLARYLKKGIELRMTRDEFIDKIQESREVYEALIKAGEKPSIDRIDSTKHYQVDNIQIISHRENARRGAVSKWKQIREKQGE